MKRKIFISINIPSKTKKRLFLATEKWQNLPIKWIKEDNLHITLFFLGYIETEAIPEICQKVREACEKKDIFDLDFSKIELAPNIDDPQYVWVSGEPSEELRSLHEEIEKALGIFYSSKKSFRPHITLGRLRKKKWVELEKKPDISQSLSFVIPVESIDVMASDFGEGDSEYSIIETCSLV